MTRVLAVRLDAVGDVILTGPAIRALAQTSDHLTLLTGPRGADAARLLPGPDDVLSWACPWIEPDSPAVDEAEIRSAVDGWTGRFDRAVVFTSFHQDPLPTALMLRLAGVRWIAAISEDYPGGLLDLRHPVTEMIPEPERALSLALAAGGRLSPHDDARLRLKAPLPSGTRPSPPYIVLHPGTSVPARAWPPELFAETAELLARQGRHVIVTGSPAERELTARVAGIAATDLGGRTTLAELASVLAQADVVVAGNTGPAHLAAAVGTPVVSLFAPTVPAEQWAPYGVPSVLLGDQRAPCANTRAVRCPLPGHPCLTSVSPEAVAEAVDQLTTQPMPPLVQELL